MKFVCLECDEVMAFTERQIPGDGTLAVVYRCETCSREMALLTNPMETRLVTGMGVKIGGREVPEQPMELVRSNLAEAREDAFVDPPAEAPPAPGTESPIAAPPRVAVRWSPEAIDRLENVPKFVRGMVKRIYTEYAQERGIERITPDVMDRARTDLGLEGM